jgi:hypothetical protein
MAAAVHVEEGSREASPGSANAFSSSNHLLQIISRTFTKLHMVFKIDVVVEEPEHRWMLKTKATKK